MIIAEGSDQHRSSKKVRAKEEEFANMVPGLPRGDDLIPMSVGH